MKRTAIIMTLVAVCCLGRQVSAAEPPKSAELKVLERFAGTWDCDIVVKPALWTSKEKREKAVEVNELTLDGWFLHGISKTADGKTKAILMNAYDPVKKEFRIWRFAHDGSCKELTGQWNETTSTLTITSDLGDGIVSRGTFHLIDQDRREYHVAAKDGDGKVYFDVYGTVTRRKVAKK